LSHHVQDVSFANSIVKPIVLSSVNTDQGDGNESF